MKRSKKLLSLILALALALSVLSSCGSKSTSDKTPSQDSKSDDDKIVVGISMATCTNVPLIVELTACMEAVCEEAGWDYILQDADQDTTVQSTQFESLINQGVDLIFYWPMDVDAAVADTKKAYDAGIPVIDFWIDAADEAHDYIAAYCGCNNQIIAEEVAKYVVETFPDGANIVIVNGFEGSPDFTIRSESFRNYLASAGKSYNILAEEYTMADRTQAQAVMENFLTAYNDIDFVFACADDYSPACLTAIEAANRQDEIVIGSIDGTDECLALIAGGKWGVDVLQNSRMLAEKCAETAKKVLAGEELDSYYQYTDYYVITKDNVSQYYSG